MDILVQKMEREDIESIVNYFLNASTDYLLGMGAEPSKLPDKATWTAYLETELSKENADKDIFYTIWQVNGKKIGHSNINNITFGQEANMHLHMWKPENRRKGIGTRLVGNSIAVFFKEFELEKIICEPYAFNPAPIKTLKRLNFKYERTYMTIPGTICFPQNVKRFVLSQQDYIDSLAGTAKNHFRNA